MDNLPAWALWIITTAVGFQSGARLAVGPADCAAASPCAVAAPGSSAAVGKTSARRTCGN